MLRSVPKESDGFVARRSQPAQRDQTAMTDRRHSTLSTQRKTLARTFVLGHLRPFSGLNVSARLGEIAQTLLSYRPIPSQPVKSVANFCFRNLGRAGKFDTALK